MNRRFVVVLAILAVFLGGLATGSVGRDVFVWRFKLYAKKALGQMPEMEWSEVMAMTALSNPFDVAKAVDEGRGLEASIDNPYTTDADLAEGKSIFTTYCSICHGEDGSGGRGPSLLRDSYTHGDSSFSIYRIIRDGIPQTAMAPSVLEAKQRWQVVAFLRSLQSAGRAFSREPRAPVSVSNEDLLSAGTDPSEWLTYSGNMRGWRYTPLSQITPDNVSQLRLLWAHQFDSEVPVQSSTPIVADGTMFVSEAPSNVAAIDVKSGVLLWRYEHPLPPNLPVCCGPVNRGVAVSGDLVYVATLDAQLVALDVHTGERRWRTRVADPAQGYTMTVAPLAFGGKVIVGVSGGEYGIRGFLSAYDAVTGVEQWRFATIPGPGEAGHETWLNDAWRTGGGPTWVTGSYDADLDLLYWGVGNPAPDYQGDVRPGDNLYTDSVLALRGSTGELVWHFQFTPHDEHDWDSNQTPILAELEFDGRTRSVICWANRNGFYYVLDRVTGEFLSGVPFVRQNWALGLDAKGRPVLADTGQVSESGRMTFPGVGGGTNWYPPAFDPMRQLVFVHANEQGSIFTKSPVEEIGRGAGGFYVASGARSSGDPILSVRALDAASGSMRWAYEDRGQTGAGGISGLLATGGGLVFGASAGNVFALDADTGEERWTSFLGGTTQAPPISFSRDGQQVIALWGGRTVFLFGL